MIALFKEGPMNGKWMEIKDHLNEVKFPERLPRYKVEGKPQTDFHPSPLPNREEARQPRRVAVYRQRSTEPEYRHVYHYMGFRYE